MEDTANWKQRGGVVDAQELGRAKAADSSNAGPAFFSSWVNQFQVCLVDFL